MLVVAAFCASSSFAPKVASEPCRVPEEIIHQQLRDFWCKAPDGKTSITQAEIEIALNSTDKAGVFVFVRQAVWDAKEIYSSYIKMGQPSAKPRSWKMKEFSL